MQVSLYEVVQLKMKAKVTLALFRTVMLLVCFVFALSLEAPSPSRLLKLALIFILLVLSLNLKEHKGVRESGFYFYTYFIDILLLFALEYNSKFLINYYFHVMYFILVLTGGIQLPRFKGTVVGVLVFMVSIIKFIRLLILNPGPVNLSVTTFSFFTFILTIVVINYGKYQAEEKERMKRLYSELKAYSHRVKELTVAEERSRIAMEIHDTLGHSMTGLITEIEVCKRLVGKDDEKVQGLLFDAANTARQGLIDVRRAVDALKPDNLGIESIKEMTEDFSKRSGIQVSFSVQPNDMQILTSQAAVLYRTIQEGLTNAAKHGNCSMVNITIVKNENTLYVVIKDNGEPGRDFAPGNGLAGIRKRVESIGGRAEFSCPGGFQINAVIPLS